MRGGMRADAMHDQSEESYDSDDDEHVQVAQLRLPPQVEKESWSKFLLHTLDRIA